MVRYGLLTLSLLLFAAGAVAAAPSVPSITASQTSCAYPCAVHFDVTGTTDASVDRPFHGLHYEWTFGDPGSGTWQWSGKSKNRAQGGVAGHLFTTAGTFNVQLKVTNPAGESDTETVAITVSAPSFTDAQTYCFATSAGTFQGCPLDTNVDGTCEVEDNCVVTSDFDVALNSGDSCSSTLDCCDIDAQANRRCLFRRGDTFVESVLVSTTGPYLVSSFGSGAKPLVTSSFGTAGSGHHAAATDGKWASIDFSSTTGGSVFSSTTPSLARFTAYDITATGFSSLWVLDVGAGPGNGPPMENLAVVDVSHTEGSTYLAGGWQSIERSNKSLYLGLEMEADPGSTANGIWRTVGGSKNIIAHGRFEGAIGHLSLRSPDPAAIDGTSNRYWLIADNRFETGSDLPLRVCQLANCVSTPSPYNDALDFIWERNFITVIGSPTNGQIWDLQAGDQTFRNNVIDITGIAFTGGNWRPLISGLSAVGSDVADKQFLNNTIVVNSGSGMTNLFICGAINDDNTGAICRNNLVYAPTVTNVIDDNTADWTDSNNWSDGEDYTGYPFPGSYDGQGLTTPDDFMLDAGETAIDAGYDYRDDSDNAFVATDAFLGCRPAGSEFDIGADEINASDCLAIAEGCRGISGSGIRLRPAWCRR